VSGDRNAALDRDGEVWAQGTYTDTWRCLTSSDYGPVLYNTLCAERGPVQSVVPATEMNGRVRVVHRDVAPPARP
jgi:hypothetical protein